MTSKEFKDLFLKLWLRVISESHILNEFNKETELCLEQNAFLAHMN